MPRWALATDLLAAALLILAVHGLYAEGPSIWVGDVRVLSLRSPLRLFGWAALVLGLRHWLLPVPRAYAPLFRLASPLPGEQIAASVPVVRWSARELGLVCGGLTAIVIVSTWPLITQLDSVSDLGDPLFSIWRLAWIAHQLPRDPLGVLDTNIFYPETLTATYSDPVIVPGLLASPLLWLGAHPVLAFNGLLLTAAVLAGLAMYLLVRDLTGSRGAAMVAGAAIAIHPHRMDNLPQIELQMTLWIPLVFWAIHRTFATGWWRYGLLAGAAFALQVLSSLYYGVFLSVSLVPLTAALWIGRRRPLRPLAALAAGAVLAAVIVAPVAGAYVRNRAMLGERDLGVVRAYSADLRDYLTPNDRSLVYGAWSAGGEAERHLFPRLTPLVLAAVALWPPLSATRVAYALVAAVAVNGSLGLNGPLYPFLYEHLPPIRGLRVPARFSVLAGVALIVLAGFGVARLTRRWPRARYVVVPALLALVVVEALPRLTLVRVWSTPPGVYDALRGEPNVVLAEYPMSSEELGPWFDARYVYFSVFHWHRMVNGYSGFFPASYAELVSRQREFPDERAVSYLKNRGVTHVTVHGAYCSPEQYAEIAADLDRRPDVELVSAVWWEGAESRLYRLR